MNKSMASEPFLEQLLMQEMSRRNTDLVAGVIGHDKNRFAQAIEIVLREEEPVSRRAMWAIDVACEKKPGLITPHLQKLIDKLEEFRHAAFRRHILRVALKLPFQEATKGKLMNACFNILIDSNQAIAVKANAMHILMRLAIEEPDIRNELAETIKHQMNEATPSFRNQALKTLSRLKKL